MDNVNTLIIGTIPARLGSSNYGGVAEVVWNLAKSLEKKDGHFCIGALGKYTQRPKTIDHIKVYGVCFDLVCSLKALKIVIKNFKEFKGLSSKYTLKLIYAVYYLLYLSKNIRFEILHVHHVINLIPQAAKLINLDKPIIGTIHSFTNILNADSHYKKAEIDLVNKQISLLDSTVFVSYSLVKQAKELGISYDQGMVIHNGISCSNSLNTDNNQSANNLLFVGSLYSHKGLKLLIDTHLKYLVNKNYELYIAGQGNLLSEVKVTSSKESSVHYLGYLDKKGMEKAMGKASVFVMPSRSESFGLVYLEALCLGAPVVGYAPIINEFFSTLKLDDSFKDWFQAFDASRESPQDLVKKIDQAAKVKKRVNYQVQAQNIKKSIGKNFSWDNISKKYINLYNQSRF